MVRKGLSGGKKTPKNKKPFSRELKIERKTAIEKATEFQTKGFNECKGPEVENSLDSI